MSTRSSTRCCAVPAARRAPAVAPAALDDIAPLDQPIEEEFRVGTLALAWDGGAGVLVIEAHQIELTEDGDDEDEPPAPPTAPPADDDEEAVAAGDVLRVRLSPAVARAFAQAGRRGRRRGTAAVPVLRAAAGPERARLPAAERLPAPVTARPRRRLGP